MDTVTTLASGSTALPVVVAEPRLMQATAIDGGTPVKHVSLAGQFIYLSEFES